MTGEGRKIPEGRPDGGQGEIHSSPQSVLGYPKLPLPLPSHWHVYANTRHAYTELILSSQALFIETWQDLEYLILNCLVVEDDIV